MRKLVVFIAALGLMTSGCAWFSSSEENSETVTAAAQPESAAPAAPAQEKAAAQTQPAKAVKAAKSTKSTKTASAKRGAKSEAQIKAELDAMGRKLAGQSKRTLLPNKASKEVRKVGDQYVATYLEVDDKNVSTEMKPGANGQYVGFIRYQEHVYECKGATRQAALSAPCTQVRARRLNELIRYDGKEWQD